MTALRVLASSLLTIALVSCAKDNRVSYDTPPPVAGPNTTAAPAAPANPIYDTPAAYEETTASTATAAPNNTTAPVDPAASTVPANGAAIIHTVVAGDTLSGLSAKYKVPAASIKQANHMKNDTVVLGRKMVIPPR